MVLHKHGERLYTGLKEVVTQHLELKVNYSALSQKKSFGWHIKKKSAKDTEISLQYLAKQLYTTNS